MDRKIVGSIEEVTGAPDEVYDISVGDNHCFFANGVLVHNSPNIVVDESSLIPNDVYGKIKRMVGGSKDNFILEIGNPFERNHFHVASLDPAYKKINADWKVAVKEGRLQKEFIEEMRKEADFGVLYENLFPPELSLDTDGYSPLVVEKDILSAFRKAPIPIIGRTYLGVDPAMHGKNFSSWVLRSDGGAKLLGKLQDTTMPEVIGRTIAYAEQYGVDENDVILDASSSGIAEMLEERGWKVRGLQMAEIATMSDKFINIRAELYFRLQRWLKEGGVLEECPEFMELLSIRYKVRESSGKYKIISKDELRLKNIPSPDVADALMLTFPDLFVEAPRALAKRVRVTRLRANRPSYE